MRETGSVALVKLHPVSSVSIVNARESPSFYLIKIDGIRSGDFETFLAFPYFTFGDYHFGCAPPKQPSGKQTVTLN